MSKSNTAVVHSINEYSPQCQDLLRHLASKGSITNVEAQAVYRMRALPRRIRDLKEKGHIIRSEWLFDPTQQRYVRYHYVEGPEVVGLHDKPKKALPKGRPAKAKA